MILNCKCYKHAKTTYFKPIKNHNVRQSLLKMHISLLSNLTFSFTTEFQVLIRYEYELNFSFIFNMSTLYLRKFLSVDKIIIKKLKFNTNKTNKRYIIYS